MVWPQVGSLLVRHFRDGLARGLARTAGRWRKQTAAAEADRLTPVVESLSRRCGPAWPSVAFAPCSWSSGTRKHGRGSHM